MNENTRRTFLKAATTIPIIGGAVLAMHSIMRYFKPTMAGGLDSMMAPPDTAPSPPQVAAELSDLQTPWACKDFIYVRSSVEYSSRKVQGAKIPGFVLRLPDEFVKDKSDPKNFYLIVQRICPHLGCTFNFVPDRDILHGSYNYLAPQPFHPYFACPCHLSVYDPTHYQDNGSGKELRGKVVSGPAPRPPRFMAFDIKDGKIFITDTEGGGVG